MQIPCRIYRKPDGLLTDTVAPGESATLVCFAGAWLPDDVAKSLGVTRFLESRTPQAKAVAPSEVEDKAVSREDTEDKAASPPRRKT